MPSPICWPSGVADMGGAGDFPNELPVAQATSVPEALELQRRYEALRDACRVVVDAWHGQSSVSLDLAMSHLEALLRKIRHLS